MHQDNFIVTSLTRNLKLFIQHTSSTETVTTQTLICFICFGSNVEKDELKVHPVDSLAIINNIWYSAKPSNTADITQNVLKVTYLNVRLGFVQDSRHVRWIFRSHLIIIAFLILFYLLRGEARTRIFQSSLKGRHTHECYLQVRHRPKKWVSYLEQNTFFS